MLSMNMQTKRKEEINMSDYEIRNECNKQEAIQYGLERMNFHVVTLNLPQQQLDAFNERAQVEKRLVI